MRCFVVCGVALVVLSLSSAAWSAEPAAPPAPAGKEDGQAAEARYQQALAQWKTLLEEMRTLRVDYKNAEPKQRGEIRRRYNQLIEQGETAQREVFAGVEKAFAEAPNADPRVIQLIVGLCMYNLQWENYEESLRLARLLIEHKIRVMQVYNMAAIAAYMVGDFADAEQYIKVAREAKVTNDEVEKELKDLAYYKEVWPREEKIRAAEAKANDLPRVLMKTSKGDIEIELFENEAPNTVANFISLVEKGFYNGLTFHRVISKFMAQGGCPKGNGTGGPGYSVPCECYEPNHRLHFRGTLSMAHHGRDTGGSQFFLTFVPTRHLDGKHTAFGRVVKGMEVLCRIQRIEPGKEEQPDPDRIVEAKVLRKRSHPYEPKTLPE